MNGRSRSPAIKTFFNYLFSLFLKSTDMFSPAYIRKKHDFHAPLKVAHKEIPEGEVHSPHVISLWGNSAQPARKPPLYSPKKLFSKAEAGEKTITHFTHQEDDDKTLWNQIISSEIPAASPPSVSEQHSRVQNAKKEYAELFQPTTSSGGFFRRFW